MAFTLRDYQTRLVDEGEHYMLAGGVPAVVGATGCGKTVVIAEATRRAIARREQVVIVAHREEIVGQIQKSVRRHTGSRTTIEVVRAGSRTSLRSQVIIGMVPTLCRRLDRLSQLAGCTLFQDECHHAGSRSWESVTEALRPRYRMGFTATPIRPNGKGLGDEGGFTRLVLGPQPGELMDMGALCRYRMFATKKQIDSDGLRKMSTGEWETAGMEEKVKAINGEIVRDWRKYNPQAHRTIFVAVSVAHAHIVAGMYRAQGIPAEAVDGKSPKHERRAIFERFRSGQTVVLCACAVIDEGLDVPEATVLQITRLTNSIRLYRQLCGRVLRPAPEKEIALIIDHTTNWKALDPPDKAINWDLFQEKVESDDDRQVTVNHETGEVVLIEAPEPTAAAIVENGAEMEEVTDELLMKARPNIARKILNDKVRFAIGVVQREPHRAPHLQDYIKMTEILDDDVIIALGEVANMPHGWAQGQIMLNMVQSGKQRDAATAKWQGVR
jgi:superfamily II DNA or RNA helicase